MWAEDFGLCELGLMPDQFWSLTVREFWVKWAGFVRAEDRRRALMFEHAAIVGQLDKKALGQLHRGVNQLRRYPIKKWLLADEPTS